MAEHPPEQFRREGRENGVQLAKGIGHIDSVCLLLQGFAAGVIPNRGRKFFLPFKLEKSVSLVSLPIPHEHGGGRIN